jgi:hypothetical protein
MNPGIKRTNNRFRYLPLLVLGLAFPAASMTGATAVEAPTPSVAQRALIEVHDTAGIGWWSSSSLEIGPLPLVTRAADAAGPIAAAPADLRPARRPGVESD